LAGIVSLFQALPYLFAALWSLPLLMAAAWVVWCVREDRRDARFEAAAVVAGGSPLQARVLLELVRDEAS